MSKIVDYSALTTAAGNDLLVINDTSDTTMSAQGTTKKITVANLLLGLAPSGDTSGATDYANISGLVTLAGQAILQAGQFYIGTNTIALVQKQNLKGAGSALTNIQYTGTTTALTVGLTGSFTGGEFAGHVDGITFDGYSAGSSAVGMQYGNIQGLNSRDLAFTGFAGKGIYFLNSPGDWAEESTMQCRLVQCGTYGSATSGAVVFDNSSFDYSVFDFTIVSSPGTHGVLLQNGAQLRGPGFRMRGNFYARATANTGVVIGLDLNNSANASYITEADFDVVVESAGSAGQIGHTSIWLNSASSASQFSGTGTLAFCPFGPSTINFQAINFPNAFIPPAFSGYLDDGTSSGSMATGSDALVVAGGTQFRPNGHLNSRPGGGVDVYWQFGDIVEGLLGNGNNSLNFHGTTGYAKKGDLFLAQPSSGAAGTVTWPANVKWPNATAPTLSSTNGFIDHLRFYYLPDSGNWYGELVGVHYA